MVPLTQATTSGLVVHKRDIALRGVNGAIASNFRGIDGGMGSCVDSSGPEDFLRGLTSLFINIMNFVLGFLTVLVKVVLLPPLLLITFVLIIIAFTLVTKNANFLCRLSPFKTGLVTKTPVSLTVVKYVKFVLLVKVPVFTLMCTVYVRLFGTGPLPGATG